MESELRSSMFINESVLQVLSFFKYNPPQQKEIIYMDQWRYCDGFVQNKTVLFRSNRSFLPGIKTDYVQSLEGLAHKNYSRFLYSKLGRKTACRLAQLMESTRKYMYRVSEYISISVSLKIREDQKPITYVVCEVEHMDCKEYDFLFRHPVGAQYRELVTQLWNTFKNSILVSKKNQPPHSLEFLTKPKHPTPGLESLHTYSHYLKKLDGIPGTLCFYDQGQIIALANGESFGREIKSHLLYAWTDHLIFRIEYLPNKKVILTDLLQGSYGEILSQLPFIYRYYYRQHLDDITQLEWNPLWPNTVPFTDRFESDGILLMDMYTCSHPCKLKYAYTIDMVYIGCKIFTSLEGTQYITDQPTDAYVVGTIYEGELKYKLFQPQKARPDKHIPDSDEMIDLCTRILPDYTLEKLWPIEFIGVQSRLYKKGQNGQNEFETVIPSTFKI